MYIEKLISKFIPIYLYSWSYLHALPSPSPRLVSPFFPFHLVATGAHACDPRPSQRKIRAARVGCARSPLGISLPRGHSQLCSSSQPVDSQLRNRSGRETAGRHPAAEKKPLCGGGHGPQLLPSSFLLFFPIFFGQGGLGKRA